MYVYRNGPPIFLLCSRDELRTTDGLLLRETEFFYDVMGILRREITQYFSVEGNSSVLIRRVARDGYGVVVAEARAGKNGRLYDVPQSRSCEADGQGRMFRVVVEFKNKKGVLTNTDVYHISYHNMFPHRRGMVRRVYSLNQEKSRFNDIRFEYDIHGQLVKQFSRAVPIQPERLVMGWRILYDEHHNPIYCRQYGHEPDNEEYSIERTYTDGLCTKAVVRKLKDKVALSEQIHYYSYKDPKFFLKE